MTLFFDIINKNYIILASDVKLTIYGETITSKYFHKIGHTKYSSTGNCAIAVSGDFPENSFVYLGNAIRNKRTKTLRDVAHEFAKQWTTFFKHREKEDKAVSAIHLVGYEETPSGNFLPQVWYWYNWKQDSGFVDGEELEANLRSFSDLNPKNNHLPRFIQERYSELKPPINIDIQHLSTEDEYLLVNNFMTNYSLILYNGDDRYWGSAGGVILSSLGLILKERQDYTFQEISEFICFNYKFLDQLSSKFFSHSTIGLTPKNKCDVLLITPTNREWIIHPNFDRYKIRS